MCKSDAEQVLKETTGEEYDHSNDLGIKGAPAMDAIGTREKDYLQMYSWLDEKYDRTLCQLDTRCPPAGYRHINCRRCLPFIAAIQEST